MHWQISHCSEHTGERYKRKTVVLKHVPCISSFGIFLESCRLSVSVLPWNSMSATPSLYVTQSVRVSQYFSTVRHTAYTATVSLSGHTDVHGFEWPVDCATCLKFWPWQNNIQEDAYFRSLKMLFFFLSVSLAINIYGNIWWFYLYHSCWWCEMLWMTSSQTYSP